MCKRILTLGILFLLVFSTLVPLSLGYDIKTSYKISEKILFSQPIIINKEEYVSIELTEKTTNSWEEGKPTLPVITKMYTFQFGTTINTVGVTFSENIEKKLSKPIIPSPEFHILPTLFNNVLKKSEEETDYSDIDIYPEQKYSYKVGAGLKDGERIIFLSVSIIPFQYIPNENLLIYSEKAIIDISYTPPANPIIFPDDYDLLIVTPVEFKTALQRLVDHKNNLDPPVRTILKTLDEIPSDVGVDTQEDIKYYIKEAVENWGIKYVLLIGAGVEGEELFPVRNIWIPDHPDEGGEDYFPSDLYFADIYDSDMGFPDWDFDDDGKYGEYPDDLPELDVLPDVYLGKLPCNNVEEVNIIVDKIINYKAHNKMTKKILQIAGDTIPGVSINEGEYANEKVMEKLPDYKSIRLWGSNGKLTKTNIGKGFRSCVDFVDFSGHGDPISWLTFPPNNWFIKIPFKTIISPYNGFFNFDIDLYKINNAQKLPVVVFAACSNCKYTESSDCIGWKMLSKKDGGGIASFGATGIASGHDGPAFVERFIGWLEVKVFEELYNTKVLGQVWANCIYQYYGTFELVFHEADYKTMLEFSMFGDPTLVIEDGDDPRNRATMDLDWLGFLEQFPILKKILNLII